MARRCAWQFCVTRMEDHKGDTATTATRYPAARLVLSVGAGVDLMNKMQQITAGLINGRGYRSKRRAAGKTHARRRWVRGRALFTARRFFSLALRLDRLTRSASAPNACSTRSTVPTRGSRIRPAPCTGSRGFSLADFATLTHPARPRDEAAAHRARRRDRRSRTPRDVGSPAARRVEIFGGVEIGLAASSHYLHEHSRQTRRQMPLGRAHRARAASGSVANWLDRRFCQNRAG